MSNTTLTFAQQLRVAELLEDEGHREAVAYVVAETNCSRPAAEIRVRLVLGAMG